MQAHAIDIDAFAEWIVAKAQKHGAALDEQNLRHARDAAERALSRDGDDIHVACTLSGAAGPVQIEERMTRTAVEVLFPKVEHHEREPAYSPTRAPKPITRAEKPRREEKEKEEEAPKGPPWSLVFALVAIVVFLVLTLLVEREKHRHESPSDDDKHEMHHH